MIAINKKCTWWRLFQKCTWWRLFQKCTWWSVSFAHVFFLTVDESCCLSTDKICFISSICSWTMASMVRFTVQPTIEHWHEPPLSYYFINHGLVAWLTLIGKMFGRKAQERICNVLVVFILNSFLYFLLLCLYVFSP
jgi:hypothetical protein